MLDNAVRTNNLEIHNRTKKAALTYWLTHRKLAFVKFNFDLCPCLGWQRAINHVELELWVQSVGHAGQILRLNGKLKQIRMNEAATEEQCVSSTN